jgi:Ca2+-binding RTX toxin-like protein
LASDDAIRGSSVADIIRGYDGHDRLYGLDNNDWIDGGIGNDHIDGGEGVDTMLGRAGDDTYYVDNATDLVSEAIDQGTDFVYATVSYTLAKNVEGVQFFGQGIIGYGNKSANTMYGDGTNATTLYGGMGNDYMVGGNAGDDLRGGDNDDTIFGQGGNDVLRGDAGNDYLSGDAGNDKFYGGAGDDTINGGVGKDTLIGDAGSDRFVFDATAGSLNVDKIVDFDITADFMVFMQSVFTELDIGPGSTLAASNFHTGTAATTADHHIIYDSAAGKLMYDADGVGGAAQMMVTTLTAGLALTNQGFLVF